MDGLNYEISVKLNEEHLFSTKPIASYEKIKAIYLQLQSKFPVSEGYKIAITRKETLVYEYAMQVK